MTSLKSYMKRVIIILMKRLYRIFKNKIFLVLLAILFLIILALRVNYTYINNFENSRNYDNKNYISADLGAKYPVIQWWNYEYYYKDDILICSENIKCLVYSSPGKVNYPQAYMFYGTHVNFDRLPLPRRPKDVVWGLFHEESPRNVAELSFEPILQLFNYSSTFSRYSDVPFPLFHSVSMLDITSTKYFIKTETKNEYLKEISPILYLNSDCDTTTNRDEYVKALMEFIPVDSYGECLNNKQFESEALNHDNYLSNLYSDEFYKFVARYKFLIAIENGRCDDYITEKFWRAILVGSVPIYFGSSTIRDWLPNEKSALIIEDFPTPKHLAEHIQKLMHNDTMYEEYLTHKTMKSIGNEKLVEEASSKPYQLDFLTTLDRFNCFVCEKLYNKKKGDGNWSIVNRYHYNCPKPISALTMSVNSSNSWVNIWEHTLSNVETIKNMVMVEP